MDSPISTLKEYYARLPENLKVFIKSSDFENAFQRISSAASLSENVFAEVKNEILFVLAGLESKTDFEENLIKNANLPKETAAKVAEEANELIFSKFEKELTEIKASGEHSTPQNLPGQNASPGSIPEFGEHPQPEAEAKTTGQQPERKITPFEHKIPDTGNQPFDKAQGKPLNEAQDEREKGEWNESVGGVYVLNDDASSSTNHESGITNYEKSTPENSPPPPAGGGGSSRGAAPQSRFATAGQATRRSSRRMTATDPSTELRASNQQEGTKTRPIDDGNPLEQSSYDGNPLEQSSYDEELDKEAVLKNIENPPPVGKVIDEKLAQATRPAEQTDGPVNMPTKGDRYVGQDPYREPIT